MEPLTVLVIDEAAQLKEYESIIPLQLPGVSMLFLLVMNGTYRQWLLANYEDVILSFINVVFTLFVMNLALFRFCVN